MRLSHCQTRGRFLFGSYQARLWRMRFVFCWPACFVGTLAPCSDRRKAGVAGIFYCEDLAEARADLLQHFVRLSLRCVIAHIGTNARKPRQRGELAQLRESMKVQ